LTANQKQQWIKAFPADFAKPWTRTYTKHIPSGFWDGQLWDVRLPKHRKPKTYAFSYIPLRWIHKIQHKLPAISWMGEVFDDRHCASSILHVGFVVRASGHLYFRHANVGKPGVRQIKLKRYIRKRRRQNRRKKHPILGCIFFNFPAQPPLRNHRTQRKFQKTHKKTGKTQRTPL
ncbi:MAG: hypothetical protein AAGJ35_06800, partial [Myxococcota bacterium]